MKFENDDIITMTREELISEISDYYSQGDLDELRNIVIQCRED